MNPLSSSAPALARPPVAPASLDDARHPQRLALEQFYPLAYRVMYRARKTDEQLLQFFQRGQVKGTVTTGAGNEATAVGMALPLRPGIDPIAILHRDTATHLMWGMTPYQLFCQFMANAESPTHAREGNAHHGDAHTRRFPMISHLGQMVAPVVGAAWGAQRRGEQVVGLVVIGDGGSSTGDIHESMNLAAVHRVPVIFLIQNNRYSFSTPVSDQYSCRHLSQRAAAYDIPGQTLDGLDPWAVYNAIWDTVDAMHRDPHPAVIECVTTRLNGHAAYDQAKYVPPELIAEWWATDPVPAARQHVLEKCGWSEAEVAAMEREIDAEVEQAAARALAVPRPEGSVSPQSVFGSCGKSSVEPFQADNVKHGDAVHHALDYLLARNPDAFLAGLDVGKYGSAFKTCKGLFEQYGRDRVIDMPLAESAIVGLALGASQVGCEPIVEFQFADFSTESCTQLGLNMGTWYFRAGKEVPVLLRFPCGGGVTMGAFHSGEFEGLWSRFPGLKLLYPATPQEMFEALVAGFYDRNPCLVFENKLLYWTRKGDIHFDGNLPAVWKSRRYTEGDELTVIGIGAMVHEAVAAAAQTGRSVEVWNPMALAPLVLEPLIASVEKTGRLLVVQEAAQTRGLGEAIVTRVVERAFSALKCAPLLVCPPDMPVPFAPELESAYRPNQGKILAAIERLLGVG